MESDISYLVEIVKSCLALVLQFTEAEIEGGVILDINYVEAAADCYPGVLCFVLLLRLFKVKERLIQQSSKLMSYMSATMLVK